MEKFKSIYFDRTETETSFKPDFGLLFNIRHFNAYVGYQPPTVAHLNIGPGYTFQFLSAF